MNPKLKMLCELYDRSDENIDIDLLLNTCFLKNLEDVFLLFSRRQLVMFSYLCSRSMFNSVSKSDIKKSRKKLKLVERWLLCNCNDREIYKECMLIDGMDNLNFSSCCYGAIISCITSIETGIHHALNSYHCSSITRDMLDMKKRYENFGIIIKVIRDGP